MKRVITYGTFDLIHPGHINILRQARDIGDFLIVGISTDDFNKIKNKQAYYTFDERRTILESIRYVDKVISENSWEQKVKDIKKHNIDTLVMGSDWEGKFDYLKLYCDVVYLPRTTGISTTKIKADLRAENKKL